MIIFRYSTGIVKSTITIPDPRIGPPPDIGELPQENFIGKSNFWFQSSPLDGDNLKVCWSYVFLNPSGVSFKGHEQGQRRK